MDNNLINRFRLCHVNCQSLLAHLDEFRSFFVNTGYHIICISESWLKPLVPDHLVSLHGYHLLRCDRIGRNGGGVAVYVSNIFQASALRQSGNGNCEGPEHLILEISVKNCSKILLAVVYRPPHCGFSDFFDVFSDLSVNYKHSIIFGDFNADLCSSTHDSEHIRSFVSASNSFLVSYTTTHHTRTASTLLDLCIVDEVEKLVGYEQREVCFLSAHDLIAITYDIKIERVPKRTIQVRDFRSFSPEDFLDELANADWSGLFSAASVDAKVEIFNNLLLTCYDKHAPFHVKQPRYLPAPWLTRDLKARIGSKGEG